jgi:hypothetical protein
MCTRSVLFREWSATMIAKKPTGDASGGVSFETRDDGGICLRVERPEPRPDGPLEIVLTHEQTQLLALMLTAAEQASSD